MSKVTLTLRADDAEPFLLAAAEDAAKFSAWCDYIGPRTGNSPWRCGTDFADNKKDWMAKFLRAKRIVEAFGVEYEQTSDAETMTVEYPYEGGKRKIIRAAGMAFGMTTGSKPNYKKPYPSYRGGIHAEACRQAAARVVKKWRATLAA